MRAFFGSRLYSNFMKNLFLLSVICACSLANAKGYSPAVLPNSSGFSIRFASNGTPLAVPPTSNLAGVAQVVSPLSLALPGGINYPAVATAVFSAASVLSPWIGAISAGLVVGSIGVAVLDTVLSQAKIRFKSGGGGLEVATSGCPSDCFAWSATFVGESTYPDRDSLVVAYLSKARSIYVGYTVMEVDAYADRRGIRISICPSSGSSCTFDSEGFYKTPVATSPTVYSPITVDAAASRLADHAPTAAEVQALVDLNFPPVPDAPTINGPAFVSKLNVVKLGLDGTVSEIDERYVASFQPGVITIGVETKQTVTGPDKVQRVVTTNQDGSTSTSIITSPATTVTASTIKPLEQVEVTCGLPGTPPCSINEVGVPVQTDVDTKMSAKPKDLQKDIDDIVKNPASFFPAFPAINWAFALPTGCAQIPTPAFAPAMTSIDVCQFKPMFHDIMSVVWMLGGLFGAISLFMRNALAS